MEALPFPPPEVGRTLPKKSFEGLRCTGLVGRPGEVDAFAIEVPTVCLEVLVHSPQEILRFPPGLDLSSGALAEELRLAECKHVGESQSNRQQTTNDEGAGRPL